jgi:uncharacterized protein with FMN-binding domain
MRRAPVVLVATAAATAGLLSFHPQGTAAPVATEPKITATSPTKTTGSSTAKGQRTVTGAVESTQYGPVQVQVTVSGGRIADVKAVQLPGADNPRSSQISASASPQLRQEALTAQSASVHVVSGATYTSQGYQASLQSALTQVGL